VRRVGRRELVSTASERAPTAGKKRKKAASGGSSTQPQYQEEVSVLRENMCRRLADKQAWEEGSGQDPDNHDDHEAQDDEDEADDAEEPGSQARAPKRA
jgi:hypothetical protein